MNDEVIYSYTAQNAIDDGIFFEIPDSYHDFDEKQVLGTQGVLDQKGLGFDKKEDDYMFFSGILEHIKKQYEAEAVEDRDFFSIKFRGVLLFVTSNDLGGLTVMLPDEY